eukprot:scaffold67126_cov73-Cyclotella_meneghiniana.AAC.2
MSVPWSAQKKIVSAEMLDLITVPGKPRMCEMTYLPTPHTGIFGLLQTDSPPVSVSARVSLAHQSLERESQISHHG